jgi:tetratricopeptide (TPR) repeat protein
MAEAAAGNFPAARKALETASGILPDSAMPLAMLVRVDVAMKDAEAVKAVLRRAAQSFPKDSELHAGLARFLAEKQLLDLALAESLRVEQNGSSAPEALVALAVVENSVGAFEDAIRHASGVETQAGVPDAVRASAAGVAGLSYESIGRRDEAIEHLKRSIELAPSQDNSYLALAFLYEKAQKFQDAVEVLQQGRRKAPGSPSFLLPLGNNLIWAEQYEAGIGVLNELIQTAPGTPEAYIRLAEAYRDTGRAELEVETLRRLSRLRPDYPMIHVLTARAMMAVEPADYPAVLHELAQAEKVTPNDADIFYLRGKVHAAMNLYQNAVADLQRAIELRPMDPAAYYQLGLVYGKLGRADLARPAMDRMQHLKEKNATPAR